MKPKPKITPAHQELFVKMLPVIQRMASFAFRDMNPEGEEEATAEVVANAYIMFIGLVERGREALAYASVLATFGIKRVRIGRKAATSQNIRDVSSKYCQIQKGVNLESLDHFDRTEGIWLEAVVEDAHTPPPDQAAFRIDFPAWLETLGSRDRKVALELASGQRPGDVARQFEISSGRVSQLRAALARRWQEFHGEEVPEVGQMTA